ncbi:MAG: T9SS type A sorting domain-containing protein [Parafilimonas sp.]
MKKIILFVIITACALQTRAQENFQKTIGGTENDFATAIAQTADGGFVTVGDTYSFGASKSDMYIVKFDSHGNLLWNKKYASSEYDHGYCVTATTDGGCVVGGISGGNSNIIILIKIDADGNLKWFKYYSAKTRHSLTSIAQTPEGGFILGGSASTYDNGSWGYILKTDDQGNVEWSKLLFDRSYYPAVQKLVVTRDSGYAAVVNQSTTNAYYDIFLVKLKKDGSFQWAKSIGGESADSPTDLIQTSDGGYAVVGSTFDLNSSPQYSFMYVFKTDSAGNFNFAKRIKGTNSDVCRTIAETNDKQLVISGYIPSPAGTASNIFFMKMDTTGRILWTKILADDNTSSDVRDFINTSDGGYAAAGAIGGYNAQDFLLAKFDTGLNICGAMPAVRDDSDFGKPVTQTVKVKDVLTSAFSTSGLQDVAGATVTSICDVLPVNLLSFTATKSKENVLLEWTTAQEINLRSFELYRSIDGVNYALLANIAPHGSQNTVSKYSFTDAKPTAGKNFYKLKSIDKEGKNYLSQIRTIDINKSFVKVFPNPVKDWLHVQLSATTGNADLRIFSTDGKLVFEKIIASANTEQLIDVRNLSPGIYSVKISTGTSQFALIFMKN